MREPDDMHVVHPGRHPGQDPQDRPARGRRNPLALLTGGIAFVAILGAAAMSIPLDTPRPAAPPSVPALRPADPLPPPAQPQGWDEDSPQVHPPTRPSVAGRAASPTEEAPPCGIDELSLTLGGWGRTTGNGAATLTATNMTDHACLVGGPPDDIRIVQGRALSLTNRTTETPGGLEQELPAPGRVLLPPRGGAAVTLWWRGYGTQADQRTPQRLALRFGAGEWRSVPITGQVGVAPFDLVDGGQIEIGPWRPAQPDPDRAP